MEGNADVVLIAVGEGIGKKVIKKIYGLDRSCFFIVVINCCVMCLK